MVRRINYIIAAWGGPRRGSKYSDLTPCGCGDYITKQLAALKRYKHSLAQVTIVNADAGEPHPELDNLPSEVAGVPVVVFDIPNCLLSVGSWQAAVQRYTNSFDYYIFIEDDYVFVRDHFDELLVGMHQPGHMVISHLEGGNGAIVLNGIVDVETLRSLGFRFGNSISLFLKSFKVLSFDAQYIVPYFCKRGIVYFGGGDELIVVPSEMVTLEAKLVEPKDKLFYERAMLGNLHDRH